MDDDYQLLQTYAATGDPAAFARLVERHMDMVYAACLRRLRNPHDAEDAAQAVFILLSQKAARMGPGTIVAGWLYQAAQFACAKVVRSTSVRRKHEMAAASSRGEMAPDKAAADLPHDDVDRALARLSAGERDAIVLRFFEGRSFGEVAATMRLTEETARKRVSRALNKLRGLLRPAHGSVLSITALEAMLAGSLHPAPPALAAQTLNSISLGAGASTSAISIAKGAAILMSISKAKVAVAGVAVLMLVSGGATVAWRATHRPQQQPVVLRAVPNSGIVAASLPLPSIHVVQGDWKAKFDRAYALADGQTLKYVAPPLMPERDLFWDSEEHKYGGHGGHLTRENFSITWDGSPHLTTMTANPQDLASVLMTCAHLKQWELDPKMPLYLPLDGDWVVRKGAATQQILDGLAPILSQKLGRTVRFELRETQKPEIIATGTYHFVPLPGHPDDGVIDLVGKPVPGEPPPYTSNKTLNELLNRLQDCSGIPVINKIGAGNTRVRVREHSVFNDGDEIVKNVARQTSLTLERKSHPAKIWMLVDVSSSRGPATVPSPKE